jgi:hypothetical protein
MLSLFKMHKERVLGDSSLLCSLGSKESSASVHSWRCRQRSHKYLENMEFAHTLFDHVLYLMSDGGWSAVPLGVSVSVCL